MIRSVKRILILVSVVLLSGCAIKLAQPPYPTWDNPRLWNVHPDGKSSAELATESGPDGPCLRLTYSLRGDYGWVECKMPVTNNPADNVPVSFAIRSEGSGNLEIKFLDGDGSIFGAKVPLPGPFTNWTPVNIYRSNTEYWWGGDDQFSGLTEFQFVVSGKGDGVLRLKNIGLARPGLPATFPPVGPVVDPNANLPGIGFEQRRAADMIPENPLVLEWLKQVQDTSSPDRSLLPSMENNECHTFNNVLVAMAFMLKGEKERAERILDFFAKATVRDNQDPTLQNFFYRGEPRGFFQTVALNPDGKVAALHTFSPNDRWMGDMAWLLIAYKYYDKNYGGDRYREITDLLKTLLLSWFKDNGNEGYVQHGWRQGDTKLHESFGHPEGNIDCFAAFTLCGEHERAGKIRAWLDRVLKGYSLPLDQYTWRVLACGKSYADRMDIPDRDLRYRKTLTAPGGGQVMGFFDHADITVTNIWLDGVGHAACAYQSCGNKQRGFFYANQLDAMAIDRDVHGVRCRAFPYTANASGGYECVHFDRGFISVAAWYIFAKNGFNPMTLEQAHP